MKTLVVFAVEWGNASNDAIVRGRFPAAEWRDALEDLEALQISVRNPPGLLFEAWQMARTYDRTVYDGLYIALAKVEGCELVTGDRRLFNAVHGDLDWTRWIGDDVVAEDKDEGESEHP